MNKVFNEDCCSTLERDLDYHYVITSPPDYKGLSKTSITDYAKYVEFLTSIISLFLVNNINILLKIKKLTIVYENMCIHLSDKYEVKVLTK
ncbi:MAG: hypothetical protein ACJZ1R_01745 [Candidatus Neomarinimicrobiota bacterium]